MISKTAIHGIWALALGLMVASYAGHQGNAETSSPGQAPETLKLGHLAKVYQPLTFSHETHSMMAEDCATCHHHTPTGATPACGKCHSASMTSKTSGAPPLKDAYHGQCIGCHKDIGAGPTGCTQCHTKAEMSAPPSAPVKEQVKPTAEDGPETLTLKSLEKRYQPVVFSHGPHTDMAENCAACHHHSPAGETPACSECHGEPFNPQNLNMPGLKGAYHLQCMGCHREIGAGPVGCTECHEKKTGATSETQEI